MCTYLSVSCCWACCSSLLSSAAAGAAAVGAVPPGGPGAPDGGPDAGACDAGSPGRGAPNPAPWGRRPAVLTCALAAVSASVGASCHRRPPGPRRPAPLRP